ncbi:atp4 subunit B of the stator stalk of mitochondrial F1F0 ATP synthase [Malassezia yamatoensis]|uniref:ATP synthase subunit 4 n=1 Tax=Malassezia yamatoensis TaxID=253288 RepID=A0AAJ6CIP2_9BASI|nr:atp4 subunit B of the stator stalk of mitochondrial F1F0 ATP synthase [Malassezia yamatoensis]
MVFRIATRSAQAATRRAVAASLTLEPTPDAKASSILDSLPGNSLISKTTWVTLGAGLTAFTVSNELYVANDETVILAAFLIFATFVGRATAQPYTDWANGAIEKIAGILNEARGKHTQAVQNRIEEVGKKGDVVETTKGLYELARATIDAEKEAFELKQRTDLAAEVKSVLDSWVRFEQQQREAEQNLVTESVIRKVAESLRDDKMQKQILESAVADIEKLVKDKKI